MAFYRSLTFNGRPHQQEEGHNLLMTAVLLLTYDCDTYRCIWLLATSSRSLKTIFFALPYILMILKTIFFALACMIFCLSIQHKAGPIGTKELPMQYHQFGHVRHQKIMHLCIHKIALNGEAHCVNLRIFNTQVPFKWRNTLRQSSIVLRL